MKANSAPARAFGRWFLKTRTKANMSQVEVAKNLKVTQGYISKVERGLLTLSVIDYCRFARMVGETLTPALLREIGD